MPFVTFDSYGSINVPDDEWNTFPAPDAEAKAFIPDPDKIPKPDRHQRILRNQWDLGAQVYNMDRYQARSPHIIETEKPVAQIVNGRLIRAGRGGLVEHVPSSSAPGVKKSPEASLPQLSQSLRQQQDSQGTATQGGSTKDTVQMRRLGSKHNQIVLPDQEPRSNERSHANAANLAMQVVEESVKDDNFLPGANQMRKFVPPHLRKNSALLSNSADNEHEGKDQAGISKSSAYAPVFIADAEFKITSADCENINTATTTTEVCCSSPDLRAITNKAQATDSHAIVTSSSESSRTFTNLAHQRWMDVVVVMAIKEDLDLQEGTTKKQLMTMEQEDFDKYFNELKEKHFVWLSVRRKY